MAETLRQSDIDALVDAVDDGPLPGGQIFSRCRSDFEDVEIRAYDFKRPERIGKDQIRALQTMHESFVRNLSAVLSGVLRTIVEIRVAGAEQMAYSEFIASLPNPTCFCLIRGDTLEGEVCLEVSPLVTYPIIDRLLGGTCSDLFIPQRSMTEIELRLMQSILGRATSALSEAWASFREVEFTIGAIEANPQIVQIVPPNELVVVLSFELRFGGRAGTMSLCLPLKAIEPLLGDLGTETWAQSGRQGGGRWEEALSRRLGGAEVPVSGVLAETTISMSELRGLEVGDIITTSRPAARPVTLAVAGRAKFQATVGQYRGNRALRVVGPLLGDEPPPGP